MARQSVFAEEGSGPTNGPDSLTGSDDRDTISLLRGNDTYSGLGGSDLIYGNQGRDLVYGNDGRDTVFGGQNADTVYGGGDADKLYGNLGDDRLFGERGNDLVYGNEGRDQLFGGDGRDTLYGGQDDDLLEGGTGDDLIVGGRGDDTAVFSGTRASYEITKNRDGSFTLDGASGRDHVETVENFRFDDGTFDVNTLLTGNPNSGGGGGTPIEPTNRPPVAQDDSVTVNTYTGQPLGLNLLANDSDPDLDPIQVDNVSNPTLRLNNSLIVVESSRNLDGSFRIASDGNRFALDILQDGAVQYTGQPIEIGQSVEFTFSYNDIDANNAFSNSAGVKVTLTGGSIPIAVPDSF